MSRDPDWEPWQALLDEQIGPRTSIVRKVIRLVGLVLVIYGLSIIVALYVGAATTTTWARMADCESGEWDRHGHPIPGSARWDDRRNGYEGGLHFAPSTWDHYRAPDMPTNGADAGVWQQVWVAEKVLAGQGWRAWPVCSRKIGVR